VSVLTQGKPNLDFTLFGTPTCKGSQTAPSTCTVTVAFAPKALGLRMGTVQISDSLGHLLVTTSLSGTGAPAGMSCNGVYYGTFKGDITVSAGQSCSLLGGGATGNVTQNGGSLFINFGTIGNNVTVSGGGAFLIGGSTIKGNLAVQNLPAGTLENGVCQTTVGGNLQFQNNGTPVLIGSSVSYCPGNTIGGDLQASNNTAPIEMSLNTVQGNLVAQSNTASTLMVQNTVGGSLTDQGNTASTEMDFNRVRGNLTDQNNTGTNTLFVNSAGGNLTVQNNQGATALYSNTVTKDLQCQGNSSITGFGNTAAQKQGQCSGF
jgi:hypothetical protein